MKFETSLSHMYKNSKKQGDVGVAQAISYFAKLGYTVLFPLSDSQDYDLVVDDGISLKKVQVKTGRSFSRDGTPIIPLRTLGGNRSWSGKIKVVIETDIDLLFCYHMTAGAYLMPKSELVVKTVLVLNSSKDKFKI